MEPNTCSPHSDLCCQSPFTNSSFFLYNYHLFPRCQHFNIIFWGGVIYHYFGNKETLKHSLEWIFPLHSIYSELTKKKGAPFLYISALILSTEIQIFTSFREKAITWETSTSTSGSFWLITMSHIRYISRLLAQANNKQE